MEFYLCLRFSFCGQSTVPSSAFVNALDVAEGFAVTDEDELHMVRELCALFNSRVLVLSLKGTFDLRRRLKICLGRKTWDNNVLSPCTTFYRHVLKFVCSNH